MPTAIIKSVHCVSASTGTDFGVNRAVADLPAALPAGTLGDIGEGIRSIVQAVPSLIAAIDEARADPDDLYITVGSDRGRDNAFWPSPGDDVDTGNGETREVNRAHSFNEVLNVTLWDHDLSGDEPLGSIAAYATDLGQGELVKLAHNPRENSAYYVVYQVE